ncbi:MAG: glycoside hydrolase N-terminal domain-containing protein [Chitinophagaceae bacterium]
MLTIICSCLLLFGSAQTEQSNALKLWYDQPAVKWTEALPVGNGRLGGMIFGGVEQDRIQFNEETLWTGGPRDYHREGASAYLEEIRKLLREGKQKEAEKLAEEKFMGLKSNEGSKAAWVKKVRSPKDIKDDPSSVDYNDAQWKLINVPSYEGFETEGLDLDGAVWFRTTFDLPANWQGKNLVLDLNRIRDHDFTFVNGKMVGTMESTEARKYIIPKEILRPGKNTIAVQVLNYFDKGGIGGYKDTSRHIGVYPEGESMQTGISLVKKWKYYVQDDEPPAVPRYQADYQSFGDLLINWNVSGAAQKYTRELDLNSAIASTSFTMNDVQYKREYFSSQPHQAITVHFSASRKGKISFDASLTSPHKLSSVKALNENTLSLSLKVRNGALKGESILYADVKGGRISIVQNKLRIENADEVTLYLTAGTNYKSYKDVSGDPDAACVKALQSIKGKPYETIKAAHVKEYQQLFKTFSIDLGKTENEKLPTNQRIEKFASTFDPSLVSLFVQYGRYLLISSSRAGTRPANLQGIWNDLLTPPWGSKYTTNINAQMNYWPAEVLNLSSMHEPLFKMTEELVESGKKAAKAHYNARGWVLHHNTDLWRGAAPINASNHGIWVTGGAWLCQHLWEHFRFTADTNFLRNRAYPILKEAALFFADFLVKDEKTGWLISTPSNSPENGGLVAGPTMDHQIIRTLLDNTIQASKILKLDEPLRKILSEKYAAIAPNQIGKWGQLQEWLEDKDDTANKHRHVSHLWGVHPGSEINWDQTPAMMSAARQSLIYRGDAGTGWSLAWKINWWARFKDGDHTYKMIRMLISPAAKGGGAYPNLFDAHPPFQIDGNFGGAAGVAEMLVQSHTNYIDLLPALPAALADGEVKGIRARGAFELNMKWQNGQLQRVEILSKSGAPLALRYEGKTLNISTEKGKWYKFDGSLKDLTSFQQAGPRTYISLNEGWRTISNDSNSKSFNGFEKIIYNDKNWQQVQVPHNWDAYEGYRRMRHGNRHGYAWYRKTFTVPAQQKGKRYFLFFEGVGSYATVWLNGKKAGYHAGGRTTFTLDVTNIIHTDKENVLAVRADHPANIQDLPWVCGGCSDERGFSEGSQPMGIFRPVQLLITDPVRVEPFGVHVWNDSTATKESTQVRITTTVKNYDAVARSVNIRNRILDNNGNIIADAFIVGQLLKPGTSLTAGQVFDPITNVNLWSVETPYLYRMLTLIYDGKKLIDSITTPFGIRTISWSVVRNDGSNQFLLNGKPVFINGIAEYEHLIGNSHAFTDEQIRTRVMMMKSAGFNAFRDAHQPHNLLYHQYWDELGFLWWTQISAHVWYNTPEFKKNFKQLLKEWVIERRNSPSVVLWGLQNESKLPEDFARECTELIRELDPTTSSQRKVVTCNGGSGTDWDVPQNWTGTYGGNPATYGEDLQRQVLIGEYGAWRTLDLHTEGPFDQNGIYSEDRMTQLMEMKVRLSDSVKNKTAGHFMWLLTSHDNPGRVQGGEGYRELDRIGPVNYKGLLTPWEEPLDVFYMYRSNFAPKATEPMVYIVSHTWPNRWTTTGKKDGIVVYSNCDEVELFNDVNGSSFGKKQKGKIGTHFQWDRIEVQYNVLYVIGYVNGKAVAKDYIVLHHLPQSPHFNEFFQNTTSITAPHAGYNYLYRVNCGGPAYIDENSNRWMADRQFAGKNSLGSTSWTADFSGMPSFFASQRRTFDPINGTKDWELFQTFRYGRDKLRYYFPVPDGEYLVELYFTEPWLGTGGGMDCTGWRLFDVAINDETVLRNIDIWKEVGHDGALKKTVKVKIKGGQLVISFPKVASGQAVISAIAIASSDNNIKPVPLPRSLIQKIGTEEKLSGISWSVEEWLDEGDKQYSQEAAHIISLPAHLFGATWIRWPVRVDNERFLENIVLTADADLFIGIDQSVSRPEWLKDYEDTKTLVVNSKGSKFNLYRRRFTKNSVVRLGRNETNDKDLAKPFVAAIPVSFIEPAYDLKSVTSYKAVNAVFKGPGISKGQIDGKERVIFAKASADNVLEWNFVVGVADTYSLTISYNNATQQVITGKLELLSADGTLMKTENVEFTPTRAGKSNYISSSTGSMINAGSYKLRLTSAKAENVSINSLDVQ